VSLASPPARNDRALSQRLRFRPLRPRRLPLRLNERAGRSPPPDRGTRIERPRAGWARRPVLGRVDRQPSPVDLAVVKELDRCGGLGLGGKLDERESPGPPGLAIRGQVRLDDAARFGQERGQRIRGGAEGQIPDEDAGRDGWCPPVLFRVRSFRSRQWSFSTLAASFPGRRGGPDLLGEHAHVERTRWRFASTHWQSAWLHWTK
jgi:hypothetical protein